MKNFRVKENGISLIALVITIIVLIILTNVLVYNSLDRIYIKKITNLNNDIELLREKTSDFYEQYGKIPAEIKYPKDNLTELKDVLSIKNDIGDFYVIDLEAMQGITLNYGIDYVIERYIHFGPGNSLVRKIRKKYFKIKYKQG